MNHPHDLLIDLLDGTLDADARARVEAHLGSCETCRSDLTFATVGRDAARSLPEEPAPAELHERVVVAAAGGAAATHPQWSRWIGAAAAAAVVAAIAVALPNVGTVERGSAGGAAPEAAAAQDAAGGAQITGAANVPLEVSDTNYDARDLETLAKDAREPGPFGTAQPAETGDASAPIRCIEQSLGSTVRGKLVRLIEARFGGTPAYIAVYREGPGAGQGADIATVYAAAKDGCAFLSTAFAKI